MSTHSLPPAIFLMGSTASGKTRLAIELSQKYPVEIISVDSALIYKGMDIGTAKPTAEELAVAPHFLIDILDPIQSYSAADFCDDALEKMKEITERGNIPLLVGGTMLYFKALLEGLSPLPKADPIIRAQLLLEAEEEGLASLHQKLLKIDPVAAQRIHPNDPQRLIRALEVFRITGSNLSQLMQIKQNKMLYNVTQFAVFTDNRALLHERIEQRFYKMMQEGFEIEVQILYNRGDLHEELPSIRCVGYRQLWQSCDQQISLDEAAFKGICATRQLAKRQLTWLRSWPDLIKLNSETEKESLKKIINHL